MSLVRLLVRLATVKALTGATWAGNAVRDSEIAPIDTAATNERQPFISVYIDETRTSPQGKDLLAGSSDMSLVLEIGITAQMCMRDEMGREVTEQGIPVTDAGLELTLDVIQRQALSALMDPQNAWADLWRTMVSSVRSIEMQRGAKASDGPRFAGRQIVMSCATLRDPAVSATLTGIWPTALALIEADPEVAYLAQVIRSLVGDGADIPAWKVVQAQRGLSFEEARALSITPPAGVEATAPDFAEPTLVEPTPGAV